MVDMPFLVTEKQCDQCLMSKDKIVSSERRNEILQQCRESDTHFICHKHTIADENSNVCCRGFYDSNPMATNLMRIALRLNAVKTVKEPVNDRKNGSDQGVLPVPKRKKRAT